MPFKGIKTTNLKGRWDSTWIDMDDAEQRIFKENLFVVKQRAHKVSGYITKNDEPDKRWECEGNFSGRFLQLNYYPSKNADDKFFQDYGCYFFDMLTEGSFNGYSVGHYWNDHAISISKHSLKRHSN